MKRDGKRIVEVEWEDAATTHGWQHKDQLLNCAEQCRSLGYVIEDNERYILLTESETSDTEKEPREGIRPYPYGCSILIPRSAIRKVTELRRAKK